MYYYVSPGIDPIEARYWAKHQVTCTVDGVFQRFDEVLRSAGFLAMSGQIVDATIVAAPKQRNTIEEKKARADSRGLEGQASQTRAEGSGTRAGPSNTRKPNCGFCLTGFREVGDLGFRRCLARMYRFSGLHRRLWRPICAGSGGGIFRSQPDEAVHVVGDIASPIFIRALAMPIVRTNSPIGPMNE
jgi:hypothetical protein